MTADPPNSYPPAVERWRPVVAKAFPDAQVGKAMWVINFESGGNPDAKGDYDPVRDIYAARGLFQIQSNANFADRPSAEFLDIASNNIAYAAKMVGPDGKGWTHWGEGALYQGKVFGALGNHPYPGDPPKPAAPASTDPALLARLATLEARADSVELAMFAGREQVGALPLLADRLEYARGRVGSAAVGLSPSLVELVGVSLAGRSGMGRDDLVALLEGVIAVVKESKP